jgi:hypothetical protein
LVFILPQAGAYPFARPELAALQADASQVNAKSVADIAARALYSPC